MQNPVGRSETIKKQRNTYFSYIINMKDNKIPIDEKLHLITANLLADQSKEKKIMMSQNLG